MVIVEGPDGGGKTTLIRELSSALNLPVAPKVVDSHTRPLVDLKRWTEENVAGGFRRQLFDRHRLISEPIYSALKDDDPTAAFMDQGWLLDVMHQFYACKPIIIYAMPELDVVIKNVSDPASDNEAVAEWIKHIYAGYVNRSTLDFIHGVGRLYNYKTTRLDDLVKWVEFNIAERYTNDRAVRIPRPAQAPDSAAVSRQR